MSHRSCSADHSGQQRAALLSRGRKLVKQRRDMELQLGRHALEATVGRGPNALHRLARDIGVATSTLNTFAEAARSAAIPGAHPAGPAEDG